ncbi:hypothetical protein ACFWHL_08745 [Streptomyces massasporeus]
MTTVAFAGTTWLCGALLLAPVMHDSAVRWTVACGAGAALAALAAMWGHGYARGGRTAPVPTPAPGNRSVAIEGSNSGAVSTGDTHVRPDTPHPPSRRGRRTATSQGERAITVRGDNHGPLSTGDTHGGTAP